MDGPKETPEAPTDIAEAHAGAGKAAIAARMEADLAAHTAPDDRAAAERLAIACRILAMDGHAHGLAGQVTMRAGAGRTLTTPIGPGFDEIGADDILEVDDDLNVLAGHGFPNPAVRFHLWVYRKRPDVSAIVHTHPAATSALSMIGRPLVVAHMDASMLWDDVAYLPEWPGVPIADDEGRIISAAIGDKANILLAHHGLLTTGDRVETAVYRAVHFERAARLQLDAEAAGRIRPVDPAHAAEARRFLLKPEVVQATVDLWARRAARAFPD